MSLIETATRRPVRVALACAALATLAACGGRERPQADLAAAQVNTIGVNSYLWRSALETFSFAPLLQADRRRTLQTRHIRHPVEVIGHVARRTVAGIVGPAIHAVPHRRNGVLHRRLGAGTV